MGWCAPPISLHLHNLKTVLSNRRGKGCAAVPVAMHILAADLRIPAYNRQRLRSNSRRTPMGAPHHIRNLLLGSLAPADLALLLPHLSEIPLQQGAIVQEIDTKVEHVIFPLSGMISLVAVMENGGMVETATVG